MKKIILSVLVTVFVQTFVFGQDSRKVELTTVDESDMSINIKPVHRANQQIVYQTNLVEKNSSVSYTNENVTAVSVSKTSTEQYSTVYDNENNNNASQLVTPKTNEVKTNAYIRDEHAKPIDIPNEVYQRDEYAKPVALPNEEYKRK